MPDGTPDKEDIIVVSFDPDDLPETPIMEDNDADLLRVQKLHSTTDAMVWAQEWCIVARKLEYLGKPLIDEGWMVGWFANAIMIGYDAGVRKEAEKTAEALRRDREQVE